MCQSSTDSVFFWLKMRAFGFWVGNNKHRYSWRTVKIRTLVDEHHSTLFSDVLFLIFMRGSGFGSIPEQSAASFELGAVQVTLQGLSLWKLGSQIGEDGGRPPKRPPNPDFFSLKAFSTFDTMNFSYLHLWNLPSGKTTTCQLSPHCLPATVA